MSAYSRAGAVGHAPEGDATTPPTLPGDLGWLRRGSVLTDGAVVVSDVLTDDAGVPCVMVARRPMESDGRIDCEPLCDLHGDLSDATTRAHATWWLRDWTPQDGPPPAWWCDTSRRVWVGGCDEYHSLGEAHRMMRRGAEPSTLEPVDVPALDDLAPDDDTRLPDGSRLVDALALKLVCEHLSGGAA